MVYYPTLEREIAGRSIKKKAIAESIHVCYKSFGNKISGRAPFTWPEVLTIRDIFFPDMSVEHLFSWNTQGNPTQGHKKAVLP